MVGRRCIGPALSCLRPRLLVVFFSLTTWELWLLLFALVGGASVLGLVLGRYLRRHSDTYREPFGALQGALLGVVGLILAFGLTLAVGRYENRRADVVNDANTIGTAYLRAQTSPSPNAAARRPRDSAPRLYLDSLNAMIDQQGVRLAGLNNRVPDAVLWLELLGVAVALALLGLYLSVLGRGFVPIVAAAILVSFLVVVTFDLDRPTRGLITVPATPRINEGATMSLPPAAPAPGG